MKLSILTIAACVSLVGLGCQKTPSAQVQANPQRWEYKIVSVKNFAEFMYSSAYQKMATNVDEGLDGMRNAEADSGSFEYIDGKGADGYMIDFRDLGQAGWELVAAVPETETIPDAQKSHGQDFNPQTRKLEDGYTSFNNIRTARITLFFKRPVN